MSKQLNKRWLAGGLAIMVAGLAVGIGVVSAQSPPVAPPPGFNTAPPSTAAAVTPAPLDQFVNGVVPINESICLFRPYLYNFSSKSEFANPTMFTGGTLSGAGSVRIIGSSWTSWNPQVNGYKVNYVSGNMATITFNSLQKGVLVKAETNSFGQHNYTVEAFDSSYASLGIYTRTFIGNGGAGELGILDHLGRIKKLKITTTDSSGFAYSDITWGDTIQPICPLPMTHQGAIPVGAAPAGPIDTSVPGGGIKKQ